MARPGPGLHLRDRRRVRGQPAGSCVESELEYLVASERRDIDKAVALVGAYRVGIAAHRDHLQRRGGNAPIGADRVHADEMRVVRRAEQGAPGLVQRYVW